MIVTVTYDFQFQGQQYKAAGKMVGDTIDTELNPVEWIGAAVHDALGSDYDASWVEEVFETLDPTLEQWTRFGFQFDRLTVILDEKEFELEIPTNA